MNSSTTAADVVDERKPRTYRGVIIHSQRMNSMGLRWWTLGTGRLLQADTLAGMRRLIKADLGK